ncbi:MULE domain-containing protein [Aphis craccivora]|uniref:MULE domain-containing protein n=1 Tax=Aphis craccivora TaxID=307492 RepID=A0A6G0YZC6_APHCR|nr:MULE domain-containing protein [Aphis craccivora]
MELYPPNLNYFVYYSIAKIRNILFQNAITNIETATHDVIKLVWPNCVIKGCGFHLILFMYLNPGDISVYFAFDVMPDIPDKIMTNYYLYNIHPHLKI